MKSDRGKSIDRRKAVRATGAGVAGLTFLTQLGADLFSQVPKSSQRRIFPLNHDWLYNEKVFPSGSSPTFNDRSFSRVTIPHTNRMLPWHG